MIAAYIFAKPRGWTKMDCFFCRGKFYFGNSQRIIRGLKQIQFNGVLLIGNAVSCFAYKNPIGFFFQMFVGFFGKREFFLYIDTGIDGTGLLGPGFIS